MPLLAPGRTGFTVSFADGLDTHGDRFAVATEHDELSYRALAERVRDLAGSLGGHRRLVAITAANRIESLVAYLAALQAGHPVLLLPDDSRDHAEGLIARYDPDVLLTDESGWEPHARRHESAHVLHADLALLLSTSGSTGSAKLVRLSHRNLDANAASIAQYLDIGQSDRAITALPMHYCYGLSVIHSHLLRGAGLILTETSVVDPCFWDAFRRHQATSFAGVPYTFDLLDRVDFPSMSLPSLRTVTQAGGRLAPERVQHYAELGAQRGWRLFVMYGQTEATSRMAYLPPEMTRTHPGAIGIPIPGGSFALEPLDGSDATDEGELVYRGPNVMLGYAEEPAHLASGATLDALRTGDIARRTGDGLYEIVGRRSRFLKLFGLRIDLQRVEDLLARDGVPATCTGDDAALVVAVGRAEDRDRVRQLIGEHVGLPPTRVQVCVLPELPRLSNGKPDYQTIQQLARAQNTPTEVEASHSAESATATAVAGTATAPAADGNAVRTLFATMLGHPNVDDDDTFVDLGGDSLSYVEVSVRLEQLLGHLPPDWHVTPARDLVPAPRRPRVLKHIETNVALRALAIVFVVGTHAQLFYLPGGAHVLLGVAGFNFARFQLTAGRPLRSIARIAIPSMALIALVAAYDDGFGLTHVFLVNGQLGPPVTRWRFWFIEALVQILVVLALVLAIPAVRRLERRRAFGFAAAVLLAGLAVRFGVVDLPDMTRAHFRPHEVFWIFAAGWVAAKATSWPQRLALSAAVACAVPGFFEQPVRNTLLLAGLLLLVWVPRVAIVWPLNRLAGVIAAASLYIYLTHSEVYPLFLDRHPSVLFAIAGALAAGVAVYWIAQRLTTHAERLVDARRGRGAQMRPQLERAEAPAA